MNIVSAGNQTLPIPSKYISLMKETDQNPKYHAEGNVYNHTLLVLEQFQKYAGEFDLSEADHEVLYWATILHDIGKPEVTVWKNGRWSARGHEEAGIPISRDILLKRPEISRQQRHRILDLVRWHSKPLRWGLKNEGIDAYKRLATRTDMRLLGIFAYFDLMGRLCEKPEIVSDLLRRFNHHIVPQIEREMGTYQEIQARFQAASLRKKNALWHALKFDDIRLLEKVLSAPDQPQAFSAIPIVLMYGTKPHTLNGDLKQEFPGFQPFEIPFVQSESERQNLVRTIKNSVHVYAQAGTPLVFYGDLYHEGLRGEIMQVARHVGAEIRYVFQEQTLDIFLGNTTDITDYDARFDTYKKLMKPHPWEAHKWEYR